MPSKPLHLARAGAVRIRVARNGPGRYCVHWHAYEGAPRTREHFKSKAAAIARAEELARAIADGLADVVTLTSADRDHYRRAVLTLAPLGIPLPVAIEEYAAAKALAGPASLIDCARAHTARGAAPACPPTASVVAELLADLADNRRSAAHTGRLRNDLERFAARFPDLPAVTYADLKAYLGSLTVSRGPQKGEPIGLRRRDNVRDTLVSLYRFARRPRGGQHHAYLPDRLSIAEQIPRLSIGGEVTTWTPEEVDTLLSHLATHEPLWLPWAALGAFAGLRSSEIFRLDWSHVDWLTGTIAVPARIAHKVRISRRAPFLPNLQQWLAPWRTATGPVIPWPSRATATAPHTASGPRGDILSAHRRLLARLLPALGWPAWKRNALRHSFGSNRLAIVKSIQQVALEMGNSPAQVREHYNDSTTEAAAQRYMAIAPALPLNILPIAAGQ